MLAAGAVAGATQAIAATRAVPAYDSTTAVPVHETATGRANGSARGWFLVVLILLLLAARRLAVRALPDCSATARRPTRSRCRFPPAAASASPSRRRAPRSRPRASPSPKQRQKNDQSRRATSSASTRPRARASTSTKGQKGSATLMVSGGANTVKMPNVVGSQVDQATNTLKAQGFTNDHAARSTVRRSQRAGGRGHRAEPRRGIRGREGPGHHADRVVREDKVSVPDVVGQEPRARRRHPGQRRAHGRARRRTKRPTRSRAVR